MLLNKMDRKVPYLELFLLAGILVLCVDSQECSESIQASTQPCLMAIMEEFGKNSDMSGLNFMTIFCKQEVKSAMICIFEAVKACPGLSTSLSSIPGMANMDMNSLDSMCSAVIDFSAHQVCLASALNSSRYMSCIMSTGDITSQDPCENYRVTAICSLRILQEECPSVVAAYNYSLRLTKPAGCPDVVVTPDGEMDGQCTRADVDRSAQCGASVMFGLSQFSGGTNVMEGMADVLAYICGSAKTNVTCFLEGYEKCPNFKTNSDRTGLTTTFQSKPLKDLVMTGCKNINELAKHSQCIHEQLKSKQLEECMSNASKTYKGPESPSESMTCSQYNALKFCLHDSVGEKCDHGVAEFLGKWSRIIFRTNEDCSTAGAPMIHSSIFLILAIFTTYFLL